MQTQQETYRSGHSDSLFSRLLSPWRAQASMTSPTRNRGVEASLTHSIEPTSTSGLQAEAVSQSQQVQPQPNQGFPLRSNQSHQSSKHLPSGESKHSGMRAATPSMRGLGPRGYQRSDERLLEVVADMLAEHSAIDARDIELQVTDGVVTLTGSVPTRTMKHLVIDEVEDIVGVKSTTSQLRVQRPPTPLPSPPMQANQASATRDDNDPSRQESETEPSTRRWQAEVVTH